LKGGGGGLRTEHRTGEVKQITLKGIAGTSHLPPAETSRVWSGAVKPSNKRGGVWTGGGKSAGQMKARTQPGSPCGMNNKKTKKKR